MPTFSDPVSLSNQRITNLAAPQAPSDAVRRDYADALLLSNGPILGYSPIVIVSGSKTLALSDANTTQLLSASSTSTIPTNAAVPFPIGTEITFLRALNNTSSVTSGSGVTLLNERNSSTSFVTIESFSFIKKTATDTWRIFSPVVFNMFLPGSPFCDTPSISSNDGQLATTSFVKSVVGIMPSSTNVAVSSSKTLALTDAGTAQICTATATITIPLNGVVAYPIGTEITILRSTSGTITLNPTVGVTVTNRDGAANTQTTVRNYTLLKKTDTDTWIAVNPIPDGAFLAGNPTATTQPPGTNDTTIATTAHVSAAVTASASTDTAIGTALRTAASAASGRSTLGLGQIVYSGSNITGITSPIAEVVLRATGGAYGTGELAAVSGPYKGQGVLGLLVRSTLNIGSIAIDTPNKIFQMRAEFRSATTWDGSSEQVQFFVGDGDINPVNRFVGIGKNLSQFYSPIAVQLTTPVESTSTTTGELRLSGVGIGNGRGVFSKGVSFTDSIAVSQINSSIYFNSGNTWVKRGDGSNVALSPLSLAAPVAAANVVTVPFDGVRTVLAQYSVVGPVTLTPAATRIQGAQTILVVSANGTDIPTLGSGVRLFTDSATYSNVSGTLHVYSFYELGGTIWVRISR